MLNQKTIYALAIRQLTSDQAKQLERADMILNDRVKAQEAGDTAEAERLGIKHMQLLEKAQAIGEELIQLKDAYFNLR